jgi:hypothetical protein
MLPPLQDDCDECVPEYMARPKSPMATIVSSLPFLLTFLFVAVAVSQKLFPLLSGHDRKAHHDTAHLPGVAARARLSLFKNLQLTSRSIASIIFSTNIALSAVLAELIFCEIANTVNPATRTLGLKLTLPSLLFLLIVVTPAFEIHSVVSKTGLNANGGQKGQRRLAWVLEICGLAAWLGAFWYLGKGLLGSYLQEESYLHEHTFSEGCLERIGIIGISLMASLAGFAAISSLWQTFGVKYRPVCRTTLHVWFPADADSCRSRNQISPENKPAYKLPTTCSSPRRVDSEPSSASCPTNHKRASWVASWAQSVEIPIPRSVTPCSSRFKVSRLCGTRYRTHYLYFRTDDIASSVRIPLLDVW